MQIDNVLQRTQAQDPKGPAPAEAGKDTSPLKSTDSPKPKVDTVTISEQARKLQATEAELQLLQQEPTDKAGSRSALVDAAKAKVSDGNFLLDEVVNGTAEQILNSGALSDLINNDNPLVRARLAQTGTLAAGEDKLAQVKERIASGYYNSSEVVDQTAEKILEDLLG